MHHAWLRYKRETQRTSPFFFFSVFFSISKKILNWYRNDKVNSRDKGVRGCIAVVQRVCDKTEGEEDIQEEPLKTHRPLCSSAAPKVRFNQFSFL